ncbi:MAG: hypothetical protein KJO87_08330 [Acidimicrobiia bacterium]|nr:hypothetical protein [Acidimicrobiia bacterium]
MRTLRRIAFALAVVQLAVWAAGRLAERSAPQDTDPSTDEFSLAAYTTGRAYTNRSTHLRTGSAVAVLGGITIDLTGAELDPAGATLVLKTRFGGARVQVPPGWRVEMMGRSEMGGNDLRVTDPSSLPEDAPRLSIVADTRWGGVLVTT